MIKTYLQINTLTIVLIGNFNPVIIQPSWLANKKLIREQEAEDCKVQIIHNQLVQFDLGWTSLEITNSRFEIKTSLESSFEASRDLVIGIFKYLKETPITAVGINHSQHFALPDKDIHYDFGNKLAPLSNWDDCLNEPRLLQLEIIDKKRKDKQNGYYRVKVQPSDQKLASPYGILIDFNNHLDLKEISNFDIGNVFEDNWSNSFTLANKITESIWQKASR